MFYRAGIYFVFSCDMKFFKNNGLSLIFLLLFLLSLGGQIITGHQQHNQQMIEEGGQILSISAYLTSGHFFQATFENWESEFLQMALFLVLSVFLYQKGSSESKDPDKEEDVDKEPDPSKPDAPWPVKKGGWILRLYNHSMLLAFAMLFLMSFVLHWYGSLKDYNEEQSLKGRPMESASEYLSNSRFWFESFQNWESEFLSIGSIIVLSIFLREKGSPQSKPVDAPDDQTGDS